MSKCNLQLLPSASVHIPALATDPPPIWPPPLGVFQTLLPDVPSRLPRDLPINLVVKPFQHFHHCIHVQPTLSPIKHHRLHRHLINNFLSPHRCPHILQDYRNHSPPPPCLTQVVVQGLPVAIFLRDGAAQMWKCGR